MNKPGLQIPVLYLSLVLIWGSTWAAIKISVGDAPFIMAALRFLIAALLLAVYQVSLKRPLRPPPGHMKVIAILGLGNFFVGYGFTYWGMQYVNSNITSILWATMPVQVAFFAHFMLRDEKLNFSKLFSLLGALIGSYLIFDIHSQNFNPQAALGMGVILLSISGASYSNVLFKREGSHLDPVMVNILAMLIGAFFLLVSGLVLEPWQKIQFTGTRFGAILYLAVFGSAFSFSTYFWLFKHVSVVKMSYTTFLIPIIASFWGWLLLKESLTLGSITGGIIIFLAVGLPELTFFNRIQMYLQKRF